MTNKTRKGTVMNVEIAQRLAELRRERGFSQEDLASRLGLSRQAVSKWERAESAPDMGNLIALADLYEVTIDELLRVSPEVEEDVLYESQERAESAESAAAEAADAARDAAARAEAAAVAAVTATVADGKPDAAKVVVEVNAPNPPNAPQAPSSAVPPQGAPQGFAPGAPGHPGAWVPPHVAGHQGFHGPYGPGTQQVVPPQQPIPPAASVPITPAPAPLPKDPLRSFPYPLLCAVIFLLVGFCFGWWHPGWIIFLTIPFYYWIINVLEADPGFQKWRAERAQRVQEVTAGTAAEGGHAAAGSRADGSEVIPADSGSDGSTGGHPSGEGGAR